MPDPVTNGRLPISVVLPTLNAMSLLPGHVAGMREWLDLVEEVVVVDSESTDGTREYIERHIDHGQLRMFSRPRGLYQAWNFGIAQVRSPWTYISTVGDAMSREGLQHLHAVATDLGAGVVISPPRFIDEAGAPIRAPVWPVHRLIHLFGDAPPRLLGHHAVFGMGLVTIPHAILGSSASNLYRSDCLQRSPFPVEFGMGGDTAWGLAYALRVDIALTGRVVSTFRIHEKSYDVSAYVVQDLQERMELLAAQAFEEALVGDARLRAAPESVLIRAMLEQRNAARRYQAELCRIRRSEPPWILRPTAWRARVNRNRTRRVYRQLTLDFLVRYCGRSRARAALRDLRR